MKQKTILRIARFVILLGLVLLLAFVVRTYGKEQLPERDESLDPTYPGGSRVIVEVIPADVPLQRGEDVVYAWEIDGVEYARFGRIRGLPGDVVGAREGKITVNGELVGPINLGGEAMGEVPPGKVFILAINPLETLYQDSRKLGFIDRAQVRSRIRFRLPW